MPIKLTIPEPCHEKWQAMTPTQKGAYCDTCEKEVIDFTAYSNYELARKLGRGEKLCGRFKPSQLNTPLPTLERSRWRERMAALGFTALLVGSCSPEPLQSPDIVEISVQTNAEPLKIEVGVPISADSVLIKGTIRDRWEPLPGAIVQLKGTEYSTRADMDGNFTLAIPADLPKNEQILEVLYIGYFHVEQAVHSDNRPIDIILEEDDETFLGEVIIVGREN